MLVPAGPMPSGLPNKEKVRIRQLFAEGKVGRDELLEAESASYHSAGTCTFYGTANTNQMLMEFMGLHLPGSSFVTPNTEMREALISMLERTDVFLPSGPELTLLVDATNEEDAVGELLHGEATGLHGGCRAQGASSDSSRYPAQESVWGSKPGHSIMGRGGYRRKRGSACARSQR